MINYKGAKKSDGVVLEIELTKRSRVDQLPKEIQQIVIDFTKFVNGVNPGLKVNLFGSYAHGKENEISDIDILGQCLY